MSGSREHVHGIIAIGCSAGCFESLQRILPALPPDFPVPLVILLHLPPDSGSMLPAAFKHRTSLKVKEAEDKEPLQPGTIYFAPPGYHLLVETDGSFSLSSEEPLHFSRPSIDILFESVAVAFGPAAVGIVLSGANEDGAAGLMAIREKGGYCVVENPGSALFPLMPETARRKANPDLVLSLDELKEWLSGLGYKSRGKEVIPAWYR